MNLQHFLSQHHLSSIVDIDYDVQINNPESAGLEKKKETFSLAARE